MTGNGADFYRAPDGRASKASYRSGRTAFTEASPSRAWLKIKSYAEDDFEIAGVLRERGNAPLALMTTRDGKRTYVGSAALAMICQAVG